MHDPTHAGILYRIHLSIDLRARGMAYGYYNTRPYRRRRGSSQEDEGSFFEGLVFLIGLVCKGFWRVITGGGSTKPPPPPKPTTTRTTRPPMTAPPSMLSMAPPRAIQQQRTANSGWVEIGDPLPYRRSSGVLTKGERAFWIPLLHALNGKYRVFCKVRLNDVVPCPDNHPRETYWFKKINRYHVDFVICDPVTTVPLLVVELDDRRHRRRQRRNRDEFKDAVLRAAGMTVYRVRAQQAYDPIELARQINASIATTPAPTKTIR